MILTDKLAQQIVDRTMSIIERNINVMNSHGVIIGSGDKNRLGKRHEGALIAIKKKKRVEITENNMNLYNNVKPGINLPIFLNEQIVGVIGITGVPTQISKYGELVKMAAEVSLQQAYVTEQLQFEQRLIEELVSQIIHDDIDDYFYERMERLSIDRSVPRLVIVLEWKSKEKEHQNIQKQLQFLLGKNSIKGELAASISPSVFVILKPIHHQGKLDKTLIENELNELLFHMKKLNSFQGKLAISSKCSSLHEMEAAYKKTKKTLKVGKIIHPDKEFYFYDDYIIPVLFSDIEISNEPKLHTYQLIVENDKKGELQETLQAFIEENGELNKIANCLYIHRNTLRYRLEKIHKISGKDPKNFKQLFELYISQLLYQLNAD
ncbi:CdaR family transcriptional regulator [Heyndrickxia sporothermodurans]|nr:CdaR family transcriptional regulator [Heyndrickxia sporothermodurans]